MLDQRGPPISVTRSTIALLIAVSVLAGCRAGGRRIAYDETRSFPTENGAVVTLLDYLETGRQAAQGWLDGLPEAESSALAAAVARATEASVRLAALHDVSSGAMSNRAGPESCSTMVRGGASC
ncbi:MAG TPA: hypothetical protein VMS76_03995 [Planctomycetota bacterium]|nr:hypothetical protein [Planctomycetota bacterium]